MATLVLTSSSGAPGVTTLAVGLALAWPRPVLLADCDPGAHQSVLAGYLAGTSPGGKGLLRVAEAHRDGRPLLDVVVDQTIPLSSDAQTTRLFLPGFTRPGSASLFTGVWPELCEAFAQLDDTGVDVLVDTGRVGTQGLPGPLLESATLSCLVLRSSLRSVMSARVHSGAVTGQDRHGPVQGSTGLILIAEGEPYSSNEIEKALGIPVLASVPNDPISALHLSDGRPRGRKFPSSPLARSLQTTAASLSAQLQRSLAQVRR